MTVLQEIVDSAPTGTNMLTRLTQAAIMADRGFGVRKVARVAGYSHAQIALYLKGKAPARRVQLEETLEEFEERVEIFEGKIERAIEQLSAEAGITIPRAAVIVGPADESGIPDVIFPDAYIPEVTTKELMRKPS